MASHRFVSPADALDLKKLARENRSKLYYGALVGVGILLATVVGFSRMETESVAVRPSIGEFVIRKPSMTKPFEFKKVRISKGSTTERLASAER